MSKLLLIGCTLLFSGNTIAHVKWFTPLYRDAGTIHYSLSDPVVMISIFVSIILIFVAITLERFLPSVNIIQSKQKKILFTIFNILVGVSLLASALSGSIIAPHYLASDDSTLILVYLESVIGILLILNLALPVAAILLLFLYTGTMFVFGFLESLDYINVVGIAIFLLLNNVSFDMIKEKLSPFSLPILRVFVGGTLITLALSEKILQPDLAVAFLQAHHWNFIFAAGFYNYSDTLFILSAGFFELTLGILFILGVITRTIALVLAILMITSNITFLIQGGYSDALVEIIGHLPLIATGGILTILGSGNHLKLCPLRFKFQC